MKGRIDRGEDEQEHKETMNMKTGRTGRQAAITLFIVAGVLIFSPERGTAQEDPALAPVAAMEEAPGEQSITFAVLLRQGGWAMWPLGFFSLVMIFLIVRNALMLRPRTLMRNDLHAEIETRMAEGRVAETRELCAKNSSLLTFVLDAGLERISEHDTDIEHVKEAIEEAGNEQMVTYMKPINYLSIIGGTAPMLGLLGTVSGMIKAFQAISVGGMGNPEQLAGHIGEALITTATGLVIAIPAMISYFMFKNNFIKQMSIMERTVSHWMNMYRNASTR